MGKVLDILYNPNNPTFDVRPNTYLHTAGFFYALAIFGGLISLYATLYVFGVLH